jgi:hypothetical protein
LHQCARQLSKEQLPAGWDTVQSSAYARVAFNEEQQLYFKEFLPRSPLESVKALFRGSRCKRARVNGEVLRWYGIDAPVNILWGRLPGGSEYLFTAAASGQGVNRWLCVTLADRSKHSLHQRRELLQALGSFIGRVHATGFIHGDLRPGNVLASRQDGRFQFTLLDNERLLRKVPPPGRMLLRNLMQLNMLPHTDISVTDRMRFFCAWRRHMRDLSPVEAKILGAEAYRWAMRRLHDKGLL